MNPRLAAARALAAVLSGKASLNSSLPAQLDKVEERDRGLTQDLAFGTARWQPRLDLRIRKRKGRRHDTHDDHRRAVEHDRLADNRRVASVPPRPETMRDDDN